MRIMFMYRKMYRYRARYKKKVTVHNPDLCSLYTGS